jgi:tRNA threonylcarbamoyl adenosine modification protein YeaZ
MSTVKRYLGFDTSSVTGVVVAFEVSDQVEDNLRIVAEWTLSLETSRHSERLLWTIDTVLQSAGWKLSDLTAIAVGVGPGSFTGLRIGITTAAMLAAQLKLPVIPISSLALLARGAHEFLKEMIEVNPKQNKGLEKTLIMACTDASKGEWFALTGSQKSIGDCIAMAEGDLPGIWGRGVSEKAITPEVALKEVEKYLDKHPESSWLAVGQSVQRYEIEFKTLPAKRRLSIKKALNQVQPRILAILTWEAIQQGFFRDFSALKPRYLRDSDAEVKLKKGLLKPAATEIHAPGSAFHRGGIA